MVIKIENLNIKNIEKSNKCFIKALENNSIPIMRLDYGLPTKSSGDQTKEQERFFSNLRKVADDLFND